MNKMRKMREEKECEETDKEEEEREKQMLQIEASCLKAILRRMRLRDKKPSRCNISPLTTPKSSQ